MINVELSNIWSCVSLPDLLSSEKEIFDAHMQLRSNTPGEMPCFGWLGQSEVVTARMIHTVRQTAQSIRSMGSILVVLGSGTAYLAAKAAVELLSADCRQGESGRFRVLFAGNDLSSRSLLDICRQLDGQDYCLHILSPEGGEVDTALASRGLRWMMERRYGAETKQRVFVSALPRSSMAVMAAEEGYTLLPLPQFPGGDRSALTSGALLPMAAAGIDPLAVFEGAAQGYEEYDLRAFENPVWMYAGARYALSCRDRNLELLGTFDPAFSGFARWWRSLVFRYSCTDGLGILPQWADWTAELDAMDAALCSGRYHLFETVLRASLPGGQRVNVEMDWKDYDGLGYLTDKNLSDVEEATYQALVQTHADADVPLLVLECETLDAFHLGELFYFFELSNAIFAAACGMAPFAPKGETPTRAQAARLLGRMENNSI